MNPAEQQSNDSDKSPITGHVRVKRRRDTFFVSVDTSQDSIATVRTLRLATAAAMDVDDCDIRLYLEYEGKEESTCLEDSDLLRDVGVENDMVLCAVLRLENGAFERPSVIPYPRDDLRSGVPVKESEPARAR